MKHHELSATIRNLSIELLGDTAGISRDAMWHLTRLLREYGHDDVVEATQRIDGRFSLSRDRIEAVCNEQ